MKISVIIPVYNVEKYIRRCLLSVKDQKCEDFNIECLIVDDCSPDGSMTIVRDLIEKNDDKTIVTTVITAGKHSFTCTDTYEACAEGLNLQVKLVVARREVAGVGVR